MITKKFLDNNPNIIFVFGDNCIREGYAGTAILRDHPQSYGFITKILPNNEDSSFYKINTYFEIFLIEALKLENLIKSNNNKIFYISKIGSGLANKFGIYEEYLEPFLQDLETSFKNVKILWED